MSMLSRTYNASHYHSLAQNNNSHDLKKKKNKNRIDQYEHNNKNLSEKPKRKKTTQQPHDERENSIEHRLVEQMSQQLENKNQPTSKQEKMFESIIRVKSWHLRQKKTNVNSDDVNGTTTPNVKDTTSQNKQFKMIPVQHDIIAEIMSFGEVRNKRDKRKKVVEMLNRKRELEALKNIKFLQREEADEDGEMIDYEAMDEYEEDEDEYEFDENAFGEFEWEGEEDVKDGVDSKSNEQKPKSEEQDHQFSNPVLEAQRIRKAILNKRSLIEKHIRRDIARKIKQTTSSKKEQRKLREYLEENKKLNLPKPDMMCGEHVNWIFNHVMHKVGSAKNYEEFIKLNNNRSANLHLPQIAFAGRSNVGKSSLINSVTRRKVMKTSDRPGETRDITFYNVGKIFSLVDLPGYGFAFAEPDQIAQWNQLMKDYFVTSKHLKKIYLLIDSRHGFKISDYEMMELFEISQVPYQIVLTKTDTMFVENLARVVLKLRQDYRQFIEKLITDNKIQPITDPRKQAEVEHVSLIMVSSQSQSGIAALKEDIAHQIQFNADTYNRYVKKSVSMFI